MTLLWCIASVSLLVALAAWRRARQTARRLEQISQILWELKYQHGELRNQVRRATGGAPPQQASSSSPESESNFVPLDSLKR